MRNWVVVLTSIAILGLVNWSIWQKETHFSEGEIVNLELAPVDPRSLMQGDYMTLRYQLANAIRPILSDQSATAKKEQGDWSNLLPDVSIKEGFVVVDIDENNVARFVRIDNGSVLSDSQRKLQFRVRNNRVKFATNAFFFAEGDADLYETARYGQFRLNGKGEVLLSQMLDENFKVLGKSGL